MKVLAVFLFASALWAQVFEAASIKSSTAEPDAGSGITTETGRITGRNVTLKWCIRSAYGTQESRIVGGPKWVDDERYDIDAKASGPADDPQLMVMLQALLTERFQLALHRETRPLAGYALVPGKKGILAKPSAPGTDSRSNSGPRSIDALGCDMDCLARKVSEVVHLPVANQTGIAGQFDFELKFVPDDLNAKTPVAGAGAGPTIFTAIEEQLGLKLEARKVPVEVLVIDRAEKPSAN